MSAQPRLPSLRTGRGRHPTAYLHSGEIVWLHGTTFLVKANADITIQYEDDGWNVLPMSAHLGKVLPEPLAYTSRTDAVPDWYGCR